LATNPFSTRFTRPGAIRFSDSHVDLHQLCRILEDDHNSANGKSNTFQIVGPHGCGKTTLTIAIAESFAKQGISTRWITIRGRSKQDVVRFDQYLPLSSAEGQPQILVVDGIESVNWLQRSCMLQQFRKRYWAVVLTTHRPLARIKVLTELRPSLAKFNDLCEQLLIGSQSQNNWSEKTKLAYQNANGNFREAFFELYDEFESQSQKGRPVTI